MNEEIKKIDSRIEALVDKYGDNIKLAIKENIRVEYMYALSDIRENLLEWYSFKPDAKLLQVGSDYGALTGLYSRRTGHVTVIDESADNLRINKKRHKDADNITYEAVALCDFKSSEKFDYVVFAGSLKPEFKEQIEYAEALLNTGGKIILAVCNRFGMKYWAGAPKDKYTFTRKEIEKYLPDGNAEFYYPMPDYKLPVTIYSEKYLPGKGELTHAILAYDYPPYLLLDVGATFDAVCEDGQFENFANSFLIIWSSHGEN